MARSRWKLMAGVLGLSIGGLAAVAGAGVPAGTAKRCPDPIPVGLPVIPSPVQGGTTTPEPLQFPSTPTAQLPAIPSVATPGEIVPVPFVAVASTLVEVAPMPRAGSVLILTLPVLETTLGPIPVQVIPAQLAPAPVQAVVPALPAPATQPLLPESPPVAPVPTQPRPAPVPPSFPRIETDAPLVSTFPQPTELIPPTPVPSRPVPAMPPVASEPQAPPTAFEKKLKVMLHMGDERPRFEIRDGDETYLKVVCDKVDVKSPVEKGETTSTLKASGKVTFVTPGGDGICDELTVTPGSGLVVVSGKVTFRYTWGKAETTVSGDRMTFRLGHTPGQAMATPLTVPASYSPRP